ncbi:Protein YceI [Rhodocyclaceae bacterium]|nr:Protein YceI [Rhodocyclaceae bacterium]
MKRSIAAFILAAALPLAAQAVEYNQVQVDKSAITFAYKQMGVAMDGKFRKFAAQLNFDPAKATAAKAVIDVDLASIDTGSTEADQEVAGKQWFNTKAFPTAHFASGSVKALGGNRYEVAGKLTIKGRTQDIVAPVTFAIQGGQAVFDGSFVFKRADFAIGEGPWAAFDTVANEIQIKFRILAAPGK